MKYHHADWKYEANLHAKSGNPAKKKKVFPHKISQFPNRTVEEGLFVLLVKLIRLCTIVSDVNNIEVFNGFFDISMF
jgi:hypothetical protein